MIQTALKRDNKILAPAGKSALRRLVVGLALTVALLGTGGVAFAGPESDPDLKKLEVKFFQHDYAKDDLDARLSRLEKLVFGDAKTGDTATRLKNLVAAVPNLNTFAEDVASSGSSGADSGNVSSSGSSASRPVDREAETAEREQSISNSSQYPAVTAIEKKLLGKDFSSEPIVKRLERLEVKSFGKVSSSTDLSERVDLLKGRTGVDVARTPPPGSDWSDEDEPSSGGGNFTYHQADTTPYSGNPRVPATNLGGSSGITGGGGGYGMSDRYAAPSSRPAPRTAGGTSDGLDNFDYDGTRTTSRPATPSGSYGFNPPRRVASATPSTSGLPQPAPDYVRNPSTAPPAAMGLNQRLGALESDVFAKTFPNDTLPARLKRLEETTFPGRKPAPDESLPDRVSQLEAAIQPSGGGRQVAQGQNQLQYADDGMPQPAPQRTGGGLSKIINGLGNLIGGGGYSSYPMGSNLVTDPQTGYLVDMYTGSMIDPRTGLVVGTRGGVNAVPGRSPYATGFNNGLSPMGVPFAGSSGMNSGMGMGVGGSGMRFGTGMMGGGGMGMGGMGFGMNPGMMGVWP